MLVTTLVTTRGTLLVWKKARRAPVTPPVKQACTTVTHRLSVMGAEGIRSVVLEAIDDRVTGGHMRQREHLRCVGQRQVPVGRQLEQRPAPLLRGLLGPEHRRLGLRGGARRTVLAAQ